MIISNYGVIIDKENACCGLVVDPKEYDISFFNDSFLSYEIDSKKNQIKLFSENKQVFFDKITPEIIYYSFKTDVLVIFVGERNSNKPPISVYEAKLN